VIAAWRSLVRSALVGEGDGSGDLTVSSPPTIGLRFVRDDWLSFFLYLMT
jgi:hypothetical protein